MTGDRNDWKADLAELYRDRRRVHGTFYAVRRLIADALSVALPRRQARTSFIVQDVRHALRLFRQHAFVVSITIVGLGLAIAMCTSVFSILNGALLKPYAMDDPATIVKIGRLYEQGSSTSWPYSAFVELQRGAMQSAVHASLEEGARLGGSADAPAQKVEPIQFVSGGYLKTLGGRAAIGRTLDPTDDRPGATPVAVLSHSFWKAHFRNDVSVVGRALPIGRGTVTIVGVLEPTFNGPLDRPPSFWAPFAAYREIYGAAISPASSLQVRVVARMPPGAAASAAVDELTSIARSLPPIGFEGLAAPPQKSTGVQTTSAASRIDGPDAAGVYIVIAVIVIVLGLVVALASANVANLLLAGASARAREFGVRVAMGASRQRLLRQLLSESAVIGIAAGALGLLLSMWLVPTIASAVGSTDDVSLDFRVLLFTAAIALIAGLGAGLAPARYGARSDVSGLLRSQSLQGGASPKASRLRRAFIAFQAAASMLLLVTAALFLRSAVRVTKTDLGFDANKLLTATLTYPRASSENATDRERVASYLRNAVARVGALPSVEGVSLALCPPLAGVVNVSNISRNGSEYLVFENSTDANYFKTTGLRIVRGRSYTADEVAGRAPVALVSESLVRTFYQGIEPVGATLEPVSVNGANKGVIVIGVVADALVSHMRGDGSGTTYRPIDPATLSAARLVVRTTQPDRMLRDVESALTAVDPSVRSVATLMRDDVAKFMREPRILAGLSTTVALVALLLSVLGIFGVTSFVVGQRAQEVSVRMAIGASGGDVIRLLIRQNMGPVLTGLCVGLAAALAGARVLTAALFGISPYDPVAMLSAVVVLAGTAMAAVTLPALRAARTNPANVLRQ